MNLNDVNEGIHKYKKRKRIGRGTGSGLGKTSGRGHKGQRSRAGHSQHPTFQGGAMPMIRRVAKRGFFNKFAPIVGEVNVADLERQIYENVIIDYFSESIFIIFKEYFRVCGFADPKCSRFTTPTKIKARAEAMKTCTSLS